MGRSSCDGIEYGVYPFQSLFLFYSLDSLYWILDRMTHDTFFYFLLLLAHYFSFYHFLPCSFLDLRDRNAPSSDQSIYV